MGTHDGHRSRMRSRFIETGLNSFEDHEVLELLLFYGQPRKNTNETAHALLNRFGSLHQVFNASIADLQEVEGVSDINVFLTSQLRVENGKNAADLAVKAVTPAEPGFITVKIVDLLDIEAVGSSPARVHAIKHLSPILRFRTA